MRPSLDRLIRLAEQAARTGRYTLSGRLYELASDVLCCEEAEHLLVDVEPSPTEV